VSGLRGDGTLAETGALILSHQANDYVKKLFRDRVSRRQKLLLWSLADYHNTARRAAWPSIRTLAEESLMDIRECRRVLVELEKLGIIQRIRGGGGAGDFNEYRFSELDGKDGHIALLQSASLNTRKDGHMTPLKDGQKGGRMDGWKDGQKDGRGADVIRKEREPEREQKLNTHEIEAGQRTWSAAQRELAERLNLHSYETWIAPIQAIGLQGQVLLLSAPSAECASHVSTKYASHVSAVLPGLSVEFSPRQSCSENPPRMRPLSYSARTNEIRQHEASANR
jgi:hypothetical protein